MFGNRDKFGNGIKSDEVAKKPNEKKADLATLLQNKLERMRSNSESNSVNKELYNTEREGKQNSALNTNTSHVGINSPVRSVERNWQAQEQDKASKNNRLDNQAKLMPGVRQSQSVDDDKKNNLTTQESNTANQKVIMVVDDSQTVRNIMALILNRAGYRSVRVASAMEALHTLTELIPDLIFLDVTLPGMDGLDICKIIKENPRTKKVPVVMLSGNGEVFDKVMGRLAGASDYITKPFEPESIISCINTFCGQKNRLKEGLWQRTR